MRSAIAFGVWFAVLFIYLVITSGHMGHSDSGLMLIAGPAYALTGAASQLWLNRSPSTSPGIGVSWLITGTLSLVGGTLISAILAIVMALFTGRGDFVFSADDLGLVGEVARYHVPVVFLAAVLSTLLTGRYHHA